MTDAERAIFNAAVRFVTADEEFRERYADWLASDQGPSNDPEPEVMRLSTLVQEALADLRRAVLAWQEHPTPAGHSPSAQETQR